MRQSWFGVTGREVVEWSGRGGQGQRREGEVVELVGGAVCARRWVGGIWMRVGKEGGLIAQVDGLDKELVEGKVA